MGVTGLWSLLSPVGRQIEVKSLANKKLAIDASIWIAQFLKAMRAPDGSILPNAHLLGFFRRICRLLFHGVRPVFVFDGGTPELKKRTVKARRKRRDRQTVKLKRTAEKMLLGRLKKRLLDNKEAASEHPSPMEAQQSSPAESEEEWSEEEELDFATVDMQWLFSLPPSRQYEYLVQMRDKQFASNRQVLTSVTGEPQKFSQTQMDLFLKSCTFRRELQEMRRKLGATTTGEVQRLANEPNRVFIFNQDKESEGHDLLEKPVEKVSTKPLFPLDGSKSIVEASQDFERQKRKTQQDSLTVSFEPRQKKRAKEISDEEIEWESIESDSHLTLPEPSTQQSDGPSLQTTVSIEVDQPSEEDVMSIVSEEEEEEVVERVDSPRGEKESVVMTEKSEDPVVVVTKKKFDDPAVLVTEKKFEERQEAPLLDFQEDDLKDLTLRFGDLSRQVETPTEEMFTECQELLQLFGIPYVIAPMEAEAQCAFLNSAQLVDGVVTEDSDVFLFGGQKVYKNLFSQVHYVEEYLMKDIEYELGLTQSRIIDLALLLGSDYTEGVHGIGIVNAMETLSAFSGPDGLEEFAKWARDEALEEEVLTLTKGENSSEEEAQEVEVRFKEQHKEVRRGWDIPASFPNQFVRNAYHKPIVDNNTDRFTFGQPDVTLLKNFCREKFEWKDNKIEAMLAPVLERYRRAQRQLTIDCFLTERRRFAKIKSQRLQDAVIAITGRPTSDIMMKKEEETSPRDKSSKKKRLS